MRKQLSVGVLCIIGLSSSVYADFDPDDFMVHPYGQLDEPVTMEDVRNNPNGNAIQTNHLPPVERVSAGFPEAMRGTTGMMEAVSAAEQDEVVEFFILKGEKLREAMDRWTKTVGYELIWMPEPEDGDIRFAANQSFTGTFAEATKDFFQIVREQTVFDAQLHSNNVLRVFVATAKR
jgi:hypothetical protein